MNDTLVIEPTETVDIPNGQPTTPLKSGVQAREALAEFDEALAQSYWLRAPIAELMAVRTQFVDAIMRDLWAIHCGETDLALYAVGGYGRCELLPHSDLDLLIIGQKPSKHQAAIENFLHELFDLHVDVGHAVRALNQVKNEAKADLTVATSMFEQRPLVTNEDLDKKFNDILNHKRLWPAHDFFRAKRREQEKRHKQFDNVDYGLEPNVKESPGGLRDVHVAMWVVERQFRTRELSALQDLGVLTEQESFWLADSRRYLNWVRFGLHLVAGRKDDRLQFEHQRTLAQQLGYVDTETQRGVERFMHEYYQRVLALREVNDILLQYFDEEILRKKERTRVEPINERFELRNDYIQTTHAEVFAQTPSALLELFVIMANRRDISGVRADTIRLIRQYAHLIDEPFRQDPTNTNLFMQLLRAPYAMVSQLTRMRRYGLLGRYIPEFGQIIGQMQHDLFHVYTVDAHTMQVVGNMRRFRYRSAEENYPVAAHCVRHLPKVELLYIAGLFHDIGKGRGGDHSSLGALDVVRFCELHKVNEDDTELVAWLVAKHLMMSDTAQRQDIYDPEVIHAFASEVKSERRLNYLYALTVADINATNPTLWNNWRATLMRQLYSETRRALRRGLESPLDRATSIRACQEAARTRLEGLNLDETAMQRTWSALEDDFFLRHTSREVAELIAQLVRHDIDTGPLVLVRDGSKQLHHEGTTSIYVYSHDTASLFAACVVTFQRLRLNVFAADIYTGPTTLCCNHFSVLEASGEQVSNRPKRRQEIGAALEQALLDPQLLEPEPAARLTRRQRQISKPSEVELINENGSLTSQLRVIATDRPGLLAQLAVLFAHYKVSVIGARIATLGDRVEDNFELQTEHGLPFSDAEHIYEFENAIRQNLDNVLVKSATRK